MSLNNGRNCNHSAISCSVPGSVSVPFPASAPSTATTSQLFFTPLPPNPPPIPLPENTSNITIMELRVPAQAVARVARQRPQVKLDATIATEILAFPGDDAFFSVNDITYQLFRNDVLLTDTLVSGNYRIAGEEDLYTFNSTFTWVDLPPDPILPPNPILPIDPIRYRIVANVGDYFHVTRAQVRNRGFTGVIHPTGPILPALPTGPI
ncbi:hypothetical protein H9I32_11805 [Bacillus sp. Xin]|uniref:hypothetical protein n=1 Tax=unclassified Bacillus (in: firmicutes) TaxID=185979 RepID=UPI001573ACEC|nr:MULTISPECIES: hypothetical protein [unclassified Bacillus (in: firmicutes)]MBC6973037.1 hypothetical protein [Bacillus sp. Xin]NSW37684.1 hypothetical protein [Bacillus sp. Xin1]